MKPKIAQTPDELNHLHLALGQYARMLWDAQAGRVAVGNRIKAVQKIGLDGEVVEALHDVAASFDEAERKCHANVRRCVRAHPLAAWIKAQRGIGLDSFANLLGVTGPIDDFPTVSKLWKYLGLHVTPAGTAPKMTAGQSWTHTDCQRPHLRTCPADCTTNHHKDCKPGVLGTAYSPKGRTVCYMLGEAIVKVGVGGPYRAAYDRRKAYYLNERERSGPSDCPMGQTHKMKSGKILACVKRGEAGETSLHVHRAAMRFAAKLLVKNLWIEWHRVLKPERLEEWGVRERERAAIQVLIPKARVPLAFEPARYDYALPTGAR